MRNRLDIAAVAIIALGAGGCVVTPQANYDGPPPAYYAAPSPTYGQTADYYWIDLADGFADAIGSSPPDFAFAWAGATAWAWTGISGEMLLIERTADGDVQYFFEPDAVTPYLVRDRYRSFAFDRSVLVAIHDPGGTIIADGARLRDRQDGDALLRRGAQLLSASRQRQWDNRSASQWYGSFGYDYVINSGWHGVWRSRPDWYDVHRRRPVPYWRSRHHDDERRWRRDHADRSRDWYRRGGRGAPPQMVVPPAQPAPPPAVVAPPSGPMAPVTGRRPPRNQVDPPGGPVGVMRQPPVAASVGDDGRIGDPVRQPERGRGRINDNEPGELLPMPLPDGDPVARALPPRPPMRQRPPAAAPVPVPEADQPAAGNVPRSRPAPFPRAERQPPPLSAPAATASPPPPPAPSAAPVPAYAPAPRIERPAPPPAAPPPVEPAAPAERPAPPAYAPPPPPPAPRDHDQPRVRNNSIDDDGARPD